MVRASTRSPLEEYIYSETALTVARSMSTGFPIRAQRAMTLYFPYHPKQ